MNHPRSLGKYELQGVLGQGAMGVVYKGFDPNIARFVAIKTIHTNLLETSLGQELLERFRNEAQAVGRLNHPNVVSIYEFDQDHGIPFFVMEFVEGNDLKTLLQNGKVYSPEEALHILISVLSALTYTHKLGIVHRDIKPANVFITHEGQIKLADFGIARIDSSEITQMGNVVGTPSYMSPEQCRGEAIDARSDLFSATILLYELLVGVKPFSGDNSHAILHNIVNQDPEKPSLKVARLGRRFDPIIKRGLAKNPPDRFQSAAEYKQALQLLNEKTEGKQRWATWVPISSIGLMVLVLAVLLGYWMKAQTQAINASSAVATSTLDSTETQAKIERLLKVADAHYRVGRLVSPQGSNAFEAYELILRLDPGSVAALDGIAKVKDRFFKRAQLLLLDGRKEDVRQHIQLAQQLFPNDDRIPQLDQKLAASD